MNAFFLEAVAEADAAELSDHVLMHYVAGIWADPDLRAILGDDRYFVVERLRSFGSRGYLAPPERQAICKALFAGTASLQRRVLDVQRRRDESAEGMEQPAQ